MHIPVLLQEVIRFLDPHPGKKYIDATVGSGGHAKVLLEAGARVLAIDRDSSVIPNLIRDIVAVIANFADLKAIAEENGFEQVDGILFDLGLGSRQLDDPARGFSFQKEGPLDMRYALENGRLKPSLTAAEIINTYPEKKLIKIFHEYGEELRFGKKVARAIVAERKINNCETTTQLFGLIKKSLPGKLRFRAGDVARKIFQALRIEVNEELENLEKALPQAVDVLKKHGRLVVISFHSLEDRIVKNFFNQEAARCICPPEFPVCRCDKKTRLKILTKKPIVPSSPEIETNPRAHSAKLRAAEKI